MEKKTRYCPQCGSKTNTMHCEICGRNTKSIEERFKEKDLDLVGDDIASFDHIQSTYQKKSRRQMDTCQDLQEDLDSIAKNVPMDSTRERRIPNKSRSSFQETQNQNYIMMKIIAVIILFIVCISIYYIIQTKN